MRNLVTLYSRVLPLPIGHDTNHLHASRVELLLVNCKAPPLERFNNRLHSPSDDTYTGADHSLVVDLDAVSCLLRTSRLSTVVRSRSGSSSSALGKFRRQPLREQDLSTGTEAKG